MDFTALRTLRPADFEDAADGYRASRDMASAAKDALNGQIPLAMRTALGGEAVEAAVRQLRKLSENFQYAQVECGVLTTALTTLAGELRVAQRKLAAAVETARADGCTVNPDGSVRYPPGGDAVDGQTPAGGTVRGSALGGGPSKPIDPAGEASDVANALRDQAANQHPNPYYGRAQEYADRIARAIAEATEADERWAPQIRRLAADDDLHVSHADWADTGRDRAGAQRAATDYLQTIDAPPSNGDPEGNADWWKGLSRDEQAAYVALHPASVGALDGLPAEVRDEANRAVLAETRGRYESELYGIPPRPAGGDEREAWNRKYEKRYEHLKGRLDGMATIQSRFDRVGQNQLPEAYLLGFDAEANKDGRVIIANGNPDTADHIAIYVPGTKTTLEGIEDETSKGEALWQESSSLTPKQSVSVITWFDYDAPRSAKPIVEGDLLPEAMSDDYAARGAPHLRSFLDGSEAAHQVATGDSAHTTLIGHSYGSTLIGDTAKHTSDYRPMSLSDPLPVDDVMAIGSPGMQARHAADLGIESGHMWAMGGAGDDRWVREGGRYVGLGEDSVIPTDPEFGANIMASDAAGHGAFWDTVDGTPSISLKNQANVIVGSYEDVELKREARW
ncbi:alpha/beta hydrolase [Streptomyces sp. NPDC057702]|uniref:alpha/beta hydrolase n=1 Tax=unclassified Streptomyces TaxID=2593676 RepID=UPI0036CA7C54